MSTTNNFGSDFQFPYLAYTIDMCPYCGNSINKESKVDGVVKVKALGHVINHRFKEIRCWTCRYCVKGIDDSLRRYCFGEYVLYCFRRADYLEEFIKVYQLEGGKIEKLTTDEIKGRILANKYVRFKNAFKI